MTFRPAGAPAAPVELRTPRLWLRPLRATDVERDYEAVMSSRPELRRWSQSPWPEETFTLAENLADLERHESEHLADVAYTYTVFSPDGARCVGCVYLAPLRAEEAALVREATGAETGAATRATHWVRAAEVSRELDRELFSALRAWLRGAWWFDVVAFTVAVEEERQAALCTEVGLLDAGTYTLETRGARRVFLDGVRRREPR